jgi:hypothetical protein
MASAHDHPHATGVEPEQPARDVDIAGGIGSAAADGAAGKASSSGAGRLPPAAADVHGVVDQDDEDEVDHGVAGGFASATSDGDKKATDAEAEAEHPPTVAMGLQQVEVAVHDIKDVGSGAAAADGDDMKAPGAGPPPPPPAEDDDDDLAAADEWDSGEGRLGGRG